MSRLAGYLWPSSNYHVALEPPRGRSISTHRTTPHATVHRSTARAPLDALAPPHYSHFPQDAHGRGPPCGQTGGTKQRVLRARVSQT